MDEAHVLYRFYSQGERLLYVGITMNPATRFGNHRRTQRWWEQVATIRLETFSSRQILEWAELDAIEDEHPLYNIKHSSSNPDWIDYWDYCHFCNGYTESDELIDTRVAPYDMYISDADMRIFAEFRCLNKHEFFCTFDLDMPITAKLRHESVSQ